MSIIPEEDGVVLLTIKGHRDLLVAFANRSRFEFGNALFEIGAAIPAEIGSLDGPVRERAQKCGSRGCDQHAITQTQSPKHNAVPL
jgi:hypothetical protein